MGDNLEDVLNVTMGRLEIVMRDAKAALENRTEKLIMAAILLMEDCANLETRKRVENWERLFGYAKELYIQIIVKISNDGKDQYLQSCEIMEEILICKRNIQRLMKP